MTSKEAFDIIFSLANSELAEYSPELLDDLNKFKLIVCDDLELLEILKGLINEVDEDFIIEKIIDGVKVGYSNIKDYFISNDFTGKVKEWLHNE